MPPTHPIAAFAEHSKASGGDAVQAGAPSPQPSAGGRGGKSELVYLPPQRMRSYQWAKVVGGVLFAAIFLGWLWVQGSNPVMRGVIIVLLLLTAWVVFKSVVVDHLRTSGRSLVLEGETLVVTAPERTQRVVLAGIALGQWRDRNDAELGLWLLDAHGQALAHLGADFLDTEEEARGFLRWLRQHAPGAAGFDVTWPSPGL